MRSIVLMLILVGGRALAQVPRIVLDCRASQNDFLGVAVYSDQIAQANDGYDTIEGKGLRCSHLNIEKMSCVGSWQFGKNGNLTVVDQPAEILIQPVYGESSLLEAVFNRPLIPDQVVHLPCTRH